MPRHRKHRLEEPSTDEPSCKIVARLPSDRPHQEIRVLIRRIAQKTQENCNEVGRLRKSCDEMEQNKANEQQATAMSRANVASLDGRAQLLYQELKIRRENVIRLHDSYSTSQLQKQLLIQSIAQLEKELEHHDGKLKQSLAVGESKFNSMKAVYESLEHVQQKRQLHARAQQLRAKDAQLKSELETNKARLDEVLKSVSEAQQLSWVSCCVELAGLCLKCYHYCTQLKMARATINKLKKNKENDELSSQPPGPPSPVPPAPVQAQTSPPPAPAKEPSLKDQQQMEVENTEEPSLTEPVAGSEKHSVTFAEPPVTQPKKQNSLDHGVQPRPVLSRFDPSDIVVRPSVSYNESVSSVVSSDDDESSISRSTISQLSGSSLESNGSQLSVPSQSSLPMPQPAVYPPTPKPPRQEKKSTPVAAPRPSFDLLSSTLASPAPVDKTPQTPKVNKQGKKQPVADMDPFGFGGDDAASEANTDFLSMFAFGSPGSKSGASGTNPFSFMNTSSDSGGEAAAGGGLGLFGF